MRTEIKVAAALTVVGLLGVGWSAIATDKPDSPILTIDTPTVAVLPENESPAMSLLVPEPTGETVVTSTIRPAASYQQTEDGARAAAVAYLELTEDAVSLSPAYAAALQRSLATADFADEFGADTEQKMAELTQSIPGGIVLRVAAIELRSVADGDDWLVSIWYAQAITMVDEAVVDDWRTATYRMRWEDDTWKIAAFSSERGPMPGRGTQPASTSATQFEALLSGYTDEGLD